MTFQMPAHQHQDSAPVNEVAASRFYSRCTTPRMNSDHMVLYRSDWSNKFIPLNMVSSCGSRAPRAARASPSISRGNHSIVKPGFSGALDTALICNLSKEGIQSLPTCPSTCAATLTLSRLIMHLKTPRPAGGRRSSGHNWDFFFYTFWVIIPHRRHICARDKPYEPYPHTTPL